MLRHGGRGLGNDLKSTNNKRRMSGSQKAMEKKQGDQINGD